MGVELSVLVPAYNEVDNVVPLYERVRAVLEQHGIGFELVFVDDGSRDATLVRVKELAAHDARVRYASFSRNFGHEAASTCAFKMARGRAAVLIDADLQDPPEVIPELYKKWKEGFEVVYARRLTREREGVLKKMTSYLFYRVLHLFSEVRIPADVGDFRLVDRKVLDHFNSLVEKNRFVRGMIAWLGFKQTAVDYHRAARHQGVTKYNWLKLTRLSLDALVSFSTLPLRVCIASGFLITVLSFIVTVTIVVQRLFFDLDIPGYALMTAGMFFLGGVQLTFLGMIGEYIGKIYTQVQGRPLFIVSESSEDVANT